MDYTIQTLSDPQVIAGALRGIAMIFNQDNWIGQLFGTALMISLIFILVKGVLQRGLRLDILLLQVLIVWMMFIPKTAVTVETFGESSAGAIIVDDVPYAVAIPATLAGAFARTMTEVIGTAMSSVSDNYTSILEEDPFQPARILLAFATCPAAQPLACMDSNLAETVREGIRYCGGSQLSKTYFQKSSNIFFDLAESLNVSSGGAVKYTSEKPYIPGGGGGEFVPCSTMAEYFRNLGDTFASGNFGSFSSVAREIVNNSTENRYSNSASSRLDLDEALSMTMRLTGHSAATESLALTNVMAYGVVESLKKNAGSPIDTLIEVDKTQGLFDWALDSSKTAYLFSTTAVKNMDLLFFIFIAATPIVMFVVAANPASGFKVAGTYMLFGMWTQSWTPALAIITGWYQLQIENYQPPGLEGVTVEYTAALMSHVLKTTIAASDMIGKSPYIMFTIMAGSMFALTGMASGAARRGQYDANTGEFDPNKSMSAGGSASGGASGGVDMYQQKLANLQNAQNALLHGPDSVPLTGSLAAAGVPLGTMNFGTQLSSAIGYSEQQIMADRAALGQQYQSAFSLQDVLKNGMSHARGASETERSVGNVTGQGEIGTSGETHRESSDQVTQGNGVVSQSQSGIDAGVQAFVSAKKSLFKKTQDAAQQEANNTSLPADQRQSAQSIADQSQRALDLLDAGNPAADAAAEALGQQVANHESRYGNSSNIGNQAMQESQAQSKKGLGKLLNLMPELSAGVVADAKFRAGESDTQTAKLSSDATDKSGSRYAQQNRAGLTHSQTSGNESAITTQNQILNGFESMRTASEQGAQTTARLEEASRQQAATRQLQSMVSASGSTGLDLLAVGQNYSNIAGTGGTVGSHMAQLGGEMAPMLGSHTGQFQQMMASNVDSLLQAGKGRYLPPSAIVAAGALQALQSMSRSGDPGMQAASMAGALKMAEMGGMSPGISSAQFATMASELMDGRAGVMSGVDGLMSTANSGLSSSGFGLGSGVSGVQPRALPQSLEGRRAQYDGMIQAAADRHGIPAELMHAVIRQESGYNPNAVSPAGAAGLMQLMPKLGAAYGVSPNERFDPEKNLNGGAAFLADLMKKYNGDLTKVAAAYNAGEPAVNLHGGVPPLAETQDYVKKVAGNYADELQRSQRTAQRATLDVGADGLGQTVGSGFDRAQQRVDRGEHQARDLYLDRSKAAIDFASDHGAMVDGRSPSPKMLRRQKEAADRQSFIPNEAKNQEYMGEDTSGRTHGPNPNGGGQLLEDLANDFRQGLQQGDLQERLESRALGELHPLSSNASSQGGSTPQINLDHGRLQNDLGVGGSLRQTATADAGAAPGTMSDVTTLGQMTTASALAMQGSAQESTSGGPATGASQPMTAGQSQSASDGPGAPLSTTTAPAVSEPSGNAPTTSASQPMSAAQHAQSVSEQPSSTANAAATTSIAQTAPESSSAASAAGTPQPTSPAQAATTASDPSSTTPAISAPQPSATAQIGQMASEQSNSASVTGALQQAQTMPTAPEPMSTAPAANAPQASASAQAAQLASEQPNTAPSTSTSPAMTTAQTAPETSSTVSSTSQGRSVGTSAPSTTGAPQIDQNRLQNDLGVGGVLRQTAMADAGAGQGTLSDVATLRQMTEASGLATQPTATTQAGQMPSEQTSSAPATSAPQTTATAQAGQMASEQPGSTPQTGTGQSAQMTEQQAVLPVRMTNEIQVDTKITGGMGQSGGAAGASEGIAATGAGLTSTGTGATSTSLSSTTQAVSESLGGTAVTTATPQPTATAQAGQMASEQPGSAPATAAPQPTATTQAGQMASEQPGSPAAIGTSQSPALTGQMAAPTESSTMPTQPVIGAGASTPTIQPSATDPSLGSAPIGQQTSPVQGYQTQMQASGDQAGTTPTSGAAAAMGGSVQTGIAPTTLESAPAPMAPAPGAAGPSGSPSGGAALEQAPATAPLSAATGMPAQPSGAATDANSGVMQTGQIGSGVPSQTTSNAAGTVGSLIASGDQPMQSGAGLTQAPSTSASAATGLMGESAASTSQISGAMLGGGGVTGHMPEQHIVQTARITNELQRDTQVSAGGASGGSVSGAAGIATDSGLAAAGGTISSGSVGGAATPAADSLQPTTMQQAQPMTSPQATPATLDPTGNAPAISMQPMMTSQTAQTASEPTSSTPATNAPMSVSTAQTGQTAPEALSAPQATSIPQTIAPAQSVQATPESPITTPATMAPPAPAQATQMAAEQSSTTTATQPPASPQIQNATEQSSMQQTIPTAAGALGGTMVGNALGSEATPMPASGLQGGATQTSMVADLSASQANQPVTAVQSGATAVTGDAPQAGLSASVSAMQAPTGGDQVTGGTIATAGANFQSTVDPTAGNQLGAGQVGAPSGVQGEASQPAQSSPAASTGVHGTPASAETSTGAPAPMGQPTATVQEQPSTGAPAPMGQPTATVQEQPSTGSAAASMAPAGSSGESSAPSASSSTLGSVGAQAEMQGSLAATAGLASVNAGMEGQVGMAGSMQAAGTFAGGTEAQVAPPGSLGSQPSTTPEQLQATPSSASQTTGQPPEVSVGSSTSPVAAAHQELSGAASPGLGVSQSTQPEQQVSSSVTAPSDAASRAGSVAQSLSQVDQQVTTTTTTVSQTEQQTVSSTTPNSGEPVNTPPAGIAGAMTPATLDPTPGPTSAAPASPEPAMSGSGAFSTPAGEQGGGAMQGGGALSTSEGAISMSSTTPSSSMESSAGAANTASTLETTASASSATSSGTDQVVSNSASISSDILSGSGASGAPAEMRLNEAQPGGGDARVIENISGGEVRVETQVHTENRVIDNGGGGGLPEVGILSSGASAEPQQIMIPATAGAGTSGTEASAGKPSQKGGAVAASESGASRNKPPMPGRS